MAPGPTRRAWLPWNPRHEFGIVVPVALENRDVFFGQPDIGTEGVFKVLDIAHVDMGEHACCVTGAIGA